MNEQQVPNHIYQMSTISALISGLYDGCISLNKLKQKGDFGIGTFKGLDGELTLLDGNCYRTNPDGSICLCDEKVTAPFAVVTKFSDYKHFIIKDCNDFRELTKRLDELIESKNIFYAFSIEGEFRYVKTRTVVKQERPYKPMTEVVKNQPIFQYVNVKGNIVGFRCPDYVDGLNVPGYHFHFISADKNVGGHVIDCGVGLAKIKIQNCSCFRMELPQNSTFYEMDVEDRRDDIIKVER